MVRPKCSAAAKPENSNAEPLKIRVMPKRGAATKTSMSYAENHEIEENPMDSDKSIELPANPDLANTTSGENEETNSGKSILK